MTTLPSDLWGHQEDYRAYTVYVRLDCDRCDAAILKGGAYHISANLNGFPILCPACHAGLPRQAQGQDGG